MNSSLMKAKVSKVKKTQTRAQAFVNPMNLPFQGSNKTDHLSKKMCWMERKGYREVKLRTNPPRVTWNKSLYQR